MYGEKTHHIGYLLDQPIQTPLTTAVKAELKTTLQPENLIGPFCGGDISVLERFQRMQLADFFLGVIDYPSEFRMQEFMHFLTYLRRPGILIFPTPELASDPTHPYGISHPLVGRIVYDPHTFSRTLYDNITASDRRVYNHERQLHAKGAYYRHQFSPPDSK